MRNFRVFADVAIDIHPRITVLVGPNNAGKSTLLEALAAVLGYRGGLAFAEQDFRSTDASRSARAAAPIQIELVIAPTDGSQFIPGELGQQVPQVTLSGERYFLRLETRWNSDPAVAGLESTLISLRADGQPLTALGRFPFSDSMPLHPFGAERDLKRGLAGRWSDWGRVVAESRPPAAVRTTAMKRLRAASDYLVKNSPGLDKIRDALGEAGTITGIGAMDVVLSAAPDDVDELLRQISIELKVPGAPRGFAGERHGLGTQGALLFAVYRLHAARLCSGRPNVSPVMTIEEPEVHLHPTAQRALGEALTKLPGQVIMTSHAPEMVHARVRPVVLRNDRGTAQARHSTWDSTVAANPRALFARCILVAEGLEGLALDICAKALGFSLHERGIEVIDARGQGNITAIWRVFGPAGYDLPIACLADGDAEHFLNAHLAALHKANLIPTIPTAGQRASVLARQAYFLTKVNRNVEEALAEDCMAEVDACLLSMTSESLDDWRAAKTSNKLSKERCYRMNALRPKRAAKLVPQTSTVADLTEHEARVARLADRKAAIPQVLRAITKDGTDGSRLPIGFRQALQWVEKRTRGNL